MSPQEKLKDEKKKLANEKRLRIKAERERDDARRQVQSWQNWWGAFLLVCKQELFCFGGRRRLRWR